ncbi:unnamed protein product [Closterium sp. NIES-53]
MTTTTSITRAVPLAQRPFDIFFVLFFAVHVLTAALIDAQMLLPRALFPEALRRAVTWHVETSGDFLVGSPQPWFLSLVISQFLLHVPFFLIAIYAFCTGGEWIRVPAIAYSGHAITNMIPILSEIALSQTPWSTRQKLLAIYLPFLAVPCLLLARVTLPSSLFHKKFVHAKKRL